MDMNQYERQNAAWKVEGYFVPRPLEPMQDAFDRAKAELAKHLQRQLDCCNALTWEQYVSLRKPATHQPTKEAEKP